MKRPSLSIVGLTVLALSGALVAACGGESDPADGGGGAATGGTGTGGTISGTGGGADTGGTSTGGTGTGGGSTGVWETTCTSVACSSSGLVDDFADYSEPLEKEKIDGANGTEGYWSTYAPSVAGADITPIGDAIGASGLKVTASGLTGTDGASISVSLNNVDTVSCAADLSRFTGLTITGKAVSAGSGKLSVRLVMPEIIPSDAEYPGTCNPTDKCWGPHAKTIDLPTTAGPTTVLFSDLAQPDWATPVTFDAARVIQIQLASAAQSDGFDVEITKVEFTGAGSGSCEGGMGGMGGTLN